MKDNNIVFCIVDDISTYADREIQTTIRNILDFTISNLYIKGYTVLIDTDENNVLKKTDSFDYAVVMSPGTEYINGLNFFNAVKNLTDHDFFVAGHILDRTDHDAYYELHHQCYVINLQYYRTLGRPIVGNHEYHNPHSQIRPRRSSENWHDDYTPKSVSKGTDKITYTNRCHGWNLLRLAFENDLNVLVFDESIRDNKIHYYPESPKDFEKQLVYIEHKFNYCKNDFVHKANTEWSEEIKETYEQIVIPASGTLYLDLINTGRVIFYDYNQKALDYWMQYCPRKENIEYLFVKTDLLHGTDLTDHLQSDLKTLVNLSNVFCYEGTAAKYSLQHRINAQNMLTECLKNKIKNLDIRFTLRADDGHRSYS